MKRTNLLVRACAGVCAAAPTLCCHATDAPGEEGSRIAETSGNQSQVGARRQKSSRQNSADRKDGRIEEVIVTATRRAESVQDVPISISVISADDISQRGLVGAADYLRGIPGVSQVEGGQYAQAITIRGIETNPSSHNYSSGATVATFFGETPTTTSAGLGGGSNVDLKLVDIERVEVLRGPQGTAFGSSSLGGAVRTIPMAPRLDGFEGRLAASYSATSDTGGDNYNVQAVGNFPLVTDRLAIRLVGYQFKDSGFYRNRAATDITYQTQVVAPFGAQAFAVNKDEVGSYYVRGGRAAAAFQATENLRFTLSYLTQKTETDGRPLATSGTYDQTLLQVSPRHVLRGHADSIFDTDIDLVNAMMEYSLGWADLLTSYSYIESDSQGSGLDFGHHLALSGIGLSDYRANVGEVRLVTKLDGDWNFLAGLYYEDLDDDGVFEYRWFGDPATDVFAPGAEFISIGFDRRNLTQKAAFTEVSWEFLEGLTLTGGVRAYKYERTFEGDGSGVFGGGSSRTSTDASGETFRANLSYKLSDDAHVYLGWSQGFRLGKPQRPFDSPGVCDLDGNGVMDGSTIPVAATGNLSSDEVDSYELGGKFALFDQRLTVDAAVFRMEWSGLPVRVLAPSVPQGCGFAFQSNAGDALSEGVEFQATYQVTEPFRIDFGGSWIDARLTEDVPALGARADNRLAGSPKVNANLGLQYSFELGGHEAVVRADSIYVGRFFGDILESPTTESGDYVKLDVSGRVVLGRLEVDLFVRNLTNEDAFTFRGPSPAPIQREFYGYRMRPRTVGFQLGYNF